MLQKKNKKKYNLQQLGSMLEIITKKNQKCKNRKKLENSAHIFEKTLFFYIKNNKVTICGENRSVHFKNLLKNWL
jgi:hypothetical protein